MTDKRIKMDCPFCGTFYKEIQLGFCRKGYAEVYCPNCRVKMTSTSKQDVIDKWNKRS